MNRRPEGGEWFGCPPGRLVRAALLLTAIGLAVMDRLLLLLTRPGSIPAEMLKSAGISLAPFRALALLLVAGAGAYLCVRGLRRAAKYRFSETGFQVRDGLGEYEIAWQNLEAAGTTAARSLGLRVRDREALRATHRGSGRQSEWFRTMQRFGEWDLLYPEAELGRPANELLAEIQIRTGLAPEADSSEAVGEEAT